MPDQTERDDLVDDANARFAVGDHHAAIAGYRRCVEQDPAFFDGWHALGMALMKTEQFKAAIGCGLQATTLRPNDLLAWTALSQMFMKNGQIAEAEDAKSKAMILSLGGKVDRNAGA